MNLLEALYSFLVFPGFLFSAVVGLLAGWVDRKVTARLQFRIGPPWHQNFTDIAKLFYKETVIPAGASPSVFFGMPLVALVGATMLSASVLTALVYPEKSYAGDYLVIVYLALIPSLALMLGGAASANPLASLGSSREMKLILSYELPFVIALAVPAIKSGYSIGLSSMALAQTQSGIFVGSISGTLAFLVALLVIVAKMGFVPFDMAEAETEIMAGTYIEYSGKGLAAWKLTRAVLTVALPMFLVTIFLGGFNWQSVGGWVAGLGKYLLVLVLAILIKNTNPRLRIDQAMRFFWGPVMLTAVAAVLCALMGK